MFDMLLWFAVVMVLFAVGDVVAKLTKARISSVFATLMLFLVLFVTGVLPADIIEKAGLSAASSWSVPMLLFAMGSMINLRQFMDEWRTVVTCWFGMLAVIIGVSLTIPIIGKEMALSAIPVVNGALPATQIMTEAATKAGYPLAAALAAITFAVQKFVGTPFASSASLRYAQGLIGEYRKAKSSGTLDEFMAAAGKSENRNSEAKTASKRITLAEKFDGFYSSNVCILLAVVGGLLSVWLGELTHINYAILGLVLGVIFTRLGVVPKNLLQKAQASGFINMVVFAAIIPALANISISDLIDLILPLVVVFAVSVLSIFVMMKVLPVWKILGDKSMAFGVGFCQMLGFPSTYLISVEVCNAVAEDEDEKAFLMSRVMPRLVVGGMAAMVSILVAGVMAGML